MKKSFYVLILVGVMALTSLCADAFSFKFWKKSSKTQAVEIAGRTQDFEILPTMSTVSTAKNQAWAGTFQLIWNDLVDDVVKHPVKFAGEKSTMADNLNKKEFKTSDLLESSYYKKVGLASYELKKEIEKGIKEKFNETSDILDKFDWAPEPNKYILYAMLKKDFEYLKPFDKLPDAEFAGSEGDVKYFGIDSTSSSELKRTVGVLFYNGSNDFAVSLKSKKGDTVYLYRTDDDKTFDRLYADMISKLDAYEGSKKFANVDRFKAPMIDFKSETEFPEICDKRIKHSDFMISKAIETVQFKMDETGVKLKSEAGILMKMSLAPMAEVPRYFYFDGKYVIFMLDDGKTKPYFALKVSDAKKLQK